MTDTVLIDPSRDRLTPDQLAAHEWLKNHKDRVECRALRDRDTTITLDACKDRQAVNIHVYSKSGVPNGTKGMFVACKDAECPHYQELPLAETARERRSAMFKQGQRNMAAKAKRAKLAITTPA